MLTIIKISVSFIFSLLLVLLLIHVSRKRSWYDKVDERKIHSGKVPRLGGIGFALSFIAVAGWIAAGAPEAYLGFRFIPPIAAMILILFFGAIDDFRPLAARYKLLFQIMAALCVIIPGYTFRRLFLFDIGPLGELNWIRYPLSFFWLVGLTNAVNFIDGVDGLAGGIAAMAALSYAAVFASFHSAGSVTLLCICLAAALGGFLVFNLSFSGAKIFMGDGGSQFLGFTLAFLPMIDKGNAHSALPLAYSGALLLIPVLDTLAAIIRRVRGGRRIDDPDRAHIHHKLMNLGMSPGGVCGILFALQLALSLLVFFSVRGDGRKLSVVFLGTAYLLGLGFFITIHYMNRGAAVREKFAKGSRNSLYSKELPP
ncbi:MAG: undecaprenyl/decaprenyl-phosphate alpha-N-acetylglucosaminyl 1-phosphate transferase, partial [Treponema sp.]|nr:undecaprenyl/decaprenyl-phosphate alpha-N-acetylglucosaminyl 1-phosphate transferase [Treponema sp.]